MDCQEDNVVNRVRATPLTSFLESEFFGGRTEIGKDGIGLVVIVDRSRF